MLAYVALVHRLHATIRVTSDARAPSTTTDDAVDLSKGDNAAIAGAANDLAAFYDDDLRDADTPNDVLRHLDLGDDALDLPDDVTTTIFG